MNSKQSQSIYNCLSSKVSPPGLCWRYFSLSQRKRYNKSVDEWNQKTKLPSGKRNKKMLTMRMKLVYRKFVADLIPTQLRGPCPKGIQAILWRFLTRSGSNLSGTKARGSSGPQYSGSKWTSSGFSWNGRKGWRNHSDDRGLFLLPVTDKLGLGLG